jgi:putative aldouronate transport system substrate-binding protein
MLAVSVLITVILIFSLVSCGGKKETPSVQAGAANSSPSGGAGDLPAKYFNADGTMKLPLVSEPVTFKVLWNKQAQDKGTMADKVILNNAYEATGIKWNVEEVSEQGWREKVSVVFASNDLPDLFCGRIDNLINFIDQCVDVTDMLPGYAPYMADFYFKKYPSIFGAEAFAGRMYSMPQVRVHNNVNASGTWMINTEWLKNVGMEIPETIDEFYQVLKAFKEKDANGNGNPNDEIPYSFVKINNLNGVGDRNILRWMNAFGMINDGGSNAEHYIMIEKGKAIFCPTDDRFLAMLQFLNKLYAEGLMDKDGFVQQINDFYAKASSNTVGFAVGGGLISETFGDISGKIEYILPPLTQYGRAMKTADPPAELTLHAYTITKACKRPELLLLFQEYCNTGFENRVLSLFGPEGGAWVWDNNEMVNNTDFKGKSFGTVAQARATLAPNYRMASIMEYADESRRRYTGISKKYQDAQKGFYPQGAGYKECFPLGNDTAENNAARMEMFSEIDTYMQNFVAKSVMNGISAVEWEEHKKSCEKLNAGKYIAGYQAFYDQLMSLR